MFKNAREIFELFGFKVRIDPSWFIIAALVVWSLSSSYFPPVLPGLNQIQLIGISMVAMIGLFASLVLHELSHSLVARKFDLNVGSITLFIFGGVAELEQDPQSAKSEFWIALAGPAMSFLLGGIFLSLSQIVAGYGTVTIFSAILEYLGIINFVLAIFNLLPAFPLDGGRVFRAVLWHLKKDLLTATRIASKVGTFFAIALICLGILSFFSSQLVAGIWQVLIGMFVFSASRAAYSDLVIRQTLRNYTVSSLMTSDPWVAQVDDTVQQLVDQIMLKRNVSFVPVLEGDTLLGYVDASMIQTIDQDNWNETRLGDIFAAFDEKNSTRAEALTQDVFDQMARTGNRKLLIVRNRKLEGVIALADLMTFLSIRSGLGLAPGQEANRKAQSIAHA